MSKLGILLDLMHQTYHMEIRLQIMWGFCMVVEAEVHCMHVIVQADLFQKS